MDTSAVGLAAAWTAVLVWVPRFLAFVAVLLIGYFIANAVRSLVVKMLRKSGFDSLVERGGIRAALQRSGHDAAAIVAMVVYYGLWLFTLEIAFGVFGPNAVSDLLNRVIAFLPNIFVAMAIIVVAAAIGAAVRQVVEATLGGLSYGRFLANAASIGILVIGVFAALNQLNIAPMIVNGLFYSMLAIITGSAIIAIGGGGIQPMRAQWEKALGRLEQEAPRLRMEMGGPSQPAQEMAQPQVQQARTEQYDEYGYRRSA